LINEGIFNQH